MNHKVIIVGAFEETIELCQEAGFDIVGIKVISAEFRLLVQMMMR